MSFKDYLVEDTVLTIKEIYNSIKNECSEFLKESRGNPLYRGIKDSKNPFLEIVPREDRKPRDSYIKSQETFNKFFFEHYGVKDIRSRAVFTSGSLQDVNEYGFTYAIFPVDGYTYWWSPKVFDLTISYDAALYRGEDIFQKVEYTDDNLHRAINSGKEIMILCKKYYAIRFIERHGEILDRFYPGINDEF